MRIQNIYSNVVPVVELARMVGAGVARDAFVGAAFQKSMRCMSHEAKCSKSAEIKGRNE